MFATYLVSLSLIGLSGLLIDWHRRAWRAAQSDTELGEWELRFARSQYRRRTQASSIIGLLGAAIGIRPLVPPEPLPMVLYLAALFGACAAILLLALLDVFATRHHHHRLRSEQLSAEVKLAMELRRAKAASEAAKR